MLHRLPGEFVSCQMIFFAMMHGCGAVGMCSHFVKLSSSLVGIPRHAISFQQMKIRKRAEQNDKMQVTRAF